MEDINIGAKVQEYRQMRQYSLRELAARAEMTPSMLSQIENNGANPSINTLKNIAAALNIPMFKFFQTEKASESLIVRKGNYMQLGSAKDGVIYELLTPDLSGTIEFLQDGDSAPVCHGICRKGPYRGGGRLCGQREYSDLYE